MGLIRSVSGVRGLVGSDVTAETAGVYGRAFGALCCGRVAVGYDSRRGGDDLKDAVLGGLRQRGVEGLDLGVVPTPTVGVAVRELGLSGGVVVTASHNPEEYNGFKFFSSRGIFLTGDEVARVFDLADGCVGPAAAGPAAERWDGAAALHAELVARSPLVDGASVAGRTPRVVVDCVNAAGSLVLPRLLRALGCEVVEIHCDAGRPFPRGAEPVQANLGALAARVVAERADAGLACDPDADRLALVDEQGRAVGEEYTLAIAADTVLRRVKGPVVANVSTSLMIEDVARSHGVPVHRTPVGEINVVARMLEVSAVVGGEGNGGVILPSVHPGRDAATAAALVVTALSASGGARLSELVSRFPSYAMVKRKVAASVASRAGLLDATLRAFPDGTLDDTDGAKMCWPGRWVHIRMSGTEPVVRLIAEARRPEDAEDLVRRATEAVSRISEGTGPCAAS